MAKKRKAKAPKKEPKKKAAEEELEEDLELSDEDDGLDEESDDLATEGIDAILNVAHDLQATRGWMHGIEYAQIGLIDGPGNPLAAYCAAILALETLRKRHDQVLVCCHAGSRSFAVVLMYLNLISRNGWDGCLDILRERVDWTFPVPHPAHRAAFERLNWRWLDSIIGG